MKVNIQYVHMATSEAMNEYVTNKLKKLGNKFDFIIGAEVHFEHQNNAKSKDKICKIELSVPGPRLFAHASEDNYEEAVKQTVKELEIQLKKRKQKFHTHM